MTKIMKSKRSPLGLLHQASVASEGASTTGQKRQAKIAVLELSLGRELKRWIWANQNWSIKIYKK